MPYGQSDAAIYIDGYALSGYIISFNEPTEALIEQTDGMGDSWVKQSYVGMQRATFNFDGFYDDAALATNVALVGSIGSSRLVLITIAGNTSGKTAIGFSGALEGGYTRTATRGQLHKAKATWVGNGQKTDLIIIHPFATHTTTGSNDGTAFDSVTVTSANGGIFHVQATAFTAAGGGGTKVDIKWRDSADNSSFANITGALASVTAAPTASRTTPSGTIRRYWSVGWTFDGSGGSPSVSFVAAAYRNP